MNYGPAEFYEENQRHVRLPRPVTRRRLPQPIIKANHAEAIATLKELLGTSGITLHAIIRAVCIVKNVTASDFFTPTRGARNVEDARKVYYHLGREVFRYSYSEIGRRCCRDHSTVMSGVKKVMTNLPKYAADIAAAKKLLGVE